MTPEQTRILRLARKAMIGAGIALSLSFGIAYVSYHRFQTDEQRQAENTRKERAAKRKLGELNDDLVQAGLARGDFERLRGDGTLGQLEKTRLLDAVEAALHPFGEAVTEYKLEGQREFSNPALSRLPRHKFDQHRLELTFKPMHELEFLDIWLALNDGRPGVAPIESCEIQRKEGSGVSAAGSKPSNAGAGASKPGQDDDAARPRVTRLEAQCVLIAYTIRLEAQPNALAATAPMAPPGR